MRIGRKYLRSSLFQSVVGNLLAAYLWTVRRTSRLVLEPPDLHARFETLQPGIIAMWHGQHFMMPFARPRGLDVRVMISRHAEAEINAIAARRLGLGLIRASGAHRKGEALRKGGMVGFREAMRALEEGATVALTADVPKGPAKVAGAGIVLLAKHSGRPIVPVAFATSRNIDAETWDSASISLPFSRAALVMGDPIFVPSDLPDAEIDDYRARVKHGLDQVTSRAYARAGVQSKFDDG